MYEREFRGPSTLLATNETATVIKPWPSTLKILWKKMLGKSKNRSKMLKDKTKPHSSRNAVT